MTQSCVSSGCVTLRKIADQEVADQEELLMANEDLRRTFAVGEFLRAEARPGGLIRLTFKVETPPYYRRAEGGPTQWTHAVDMPEGEVAALIVGLGGIPQG